VKLFQQNTPSVVNISNIGASCMIVIANCTLNTDQVLSSSLNGYHICRPTLPLYGCSFNAKVVLYSAFLQHLSFCITNKSKPTNMPITRECSIGKA